MSAESIPVSTQTAVPPNNTPITAGQAASALRAAYQQVTGQTPTMGVLSLLLGQTALETGDWQKMPNFNFGGIKASAGDRLIQAFDTSEVVDGVVKPVTQTFAAYASVADGAAAYIRTLRSRAHWWNGLQTATPEGFVAGLVTQPAYFTANPAQYLSGLKTRIHALWKQWGAPSHSSPPVVSVSAPSMNVASPSTPAASVRMGDPRAGRRDAEGIILFCALLTGAAGLVAAWRTR